MADMYRDKMAKNTVAGRSSGRGKSYSPKYPQDWEKGTDAIYKTPYCKRQEGIMGRTVSLTNSNQERVRNKG